MGMNGDRAMKAVLRTTVGAIMISGGVVTTGAAMADGACHADYAGAQISKYKQIQPFDAGGPVFDASKAKGKTILAIQEISSNPFTQSVEAGMKQAADKNGVKLIDYPNQGQRSQWAQGIESAIARKVDAIVLIGGTISPEYLRPQADAAEAAGIPIITVVNEDLTQPAGYKAAARVAQPYEQAARLDADWVIADANCNASVLVLGSKEVLGWPASQKAIEDEFAAQCGKTCKIDIRNIPVPDWATRIQSETQSALLADPKIKYIIPVYDGMTQFVLPAIQAVGEMDTVKVATFNGTPFALRYIQTGTPVKMDVGENNAQVGYAALDQAMRVLTGVGPIANGNTHIPLRVFDSSNVGETGTPPVLGQGYGNDFVAGYDKIWGRK
jgi:ribose transport system substrate-binding protein